MGQEEIPRDIKERTFDFAVEIVRVCRDLDITPGTPRILGRQLLRSGTSIGANVEEAQAGQSQADFYQQVQYRLEGSARDDLLVAVVENDRRLY